MKTSSKVETTAGLAALLPAILDRAFSGKLVPQNPDDEPAFKLLQRIQSGSAGKLARLK